MDSSWERNLAMLSSSVDLVVILVRGPKHQAQVNSKGTNGIGLSIINGKKQLGSFTQRLLGKSQIMSLTKRQREDNTNSQGNNVKDKVRISPVSNLLSTIRRTTEVICQEHYQNRQRKIISDRGQAQKVTFKDQTPILLRMSILDKLHKRLIQIKMENTLQL